MRVDEMDDEVAGRVFRYTELDILRRKYAALPSSD